MIVAKKVMKTEQVSVCGWRWGNPDLFMAKFQQKSYICPRRMAQPTQNLRFTYLCMKLHTSMRERLTRKLVNVPLTSAFLAGLSPTIQFCPRRNSVKENAFVSIIAGECQSGHAPVS